LQAVPDLNGAKSGTPSAVAWKQWTDRPVEGTRRRTHPAIAGTPPVEGIRRKLQETGFCVPEGKSLTDLEREILSQLLSRYEGNRTLVAEKLGISRRTIQREIKEHNLPY